MVPTDVKVALIDLLGRGRLPGDRGDVVRLAEVGAADGRRRRGDGAHPPPPGRALPGADAEPQGLRGGARGAAPTRSRCSSPPPKRSRGGTSTARIAESLERAQPIFAAAKAHGVRVRGYISCVLGCPYEGDVDPRRGRRRRRTRWTRWAPTRSRWATPSASAPRAGPRRCSRAVAERVPVGGAGRAFPRHLRPGAGQRLRGAAGGRGDVRLLGRRAGRLSLRQGRDRQRRQRGRPLPARGPRHRHRRRHDAAARAPGATSPIFSGARRCRAWRARSTRGKRRRRDERPATRTATRCRRRASRSARSFPERPCAPAASARWTRSRCGACSTPTTSARCSPRCPRAGRRSAPAAPHLRTPMIRADWYFDFVSPFAYLQSEQLAALAPRIEVRYRPVLFAGLLDAHGQKGPAEIPAKRDFTYRFVVWQARQARHPAPVSARAPVQSAAAAAPRARLRLRRAGGPADLPLRLARRAPARPADRVGGADRRARHPRRRGAHRRRRREGRPAAQHRRGDRARRVRRADAR